MISFSVDVYLSELGCLLAVLELGLVVLTFLELVWELVTDTCARFLDDTELVWLLFTPRPLGVAASVYADGLFFFTESSIFPSDALGGSPLDDFPFYPGLGSSTYGSSVTPVR